MKKLGRFSAVLILGVFFFLGNSSSTQAEGLSANTILYCPQEYIEICDEMQEKYGVSSSLLIAMIQCESSCIPDVISGEGAIGLMQVAPCNNPNNLDLTDPRTNIELGTQVLLGWRDKATDGDILLALALYEGWGNTAYRKYRQEDWYYKSFDYAHKVLNLTLEIDKIRYGY